MVVSKGKKGSVWLGREEQEDVPFFSMIFDYKLTSFVCDLCDWLLLKDCVRVLCCVCKT